MSPLAGDLDDRGTAPPHTPRVTVGAVLVGIAAIHQAVGLALGAGLALGPFSRADAPLTQMWRAGLFDSVGDDPSNNAVTWFLLWGFLLALLGAVLHEIERSGVRIPASFGWGFLATCALGVVLMPASGFWLGVIPVALTFARARRAAAPALA
jgi:hypothetical protein